MPSRTTTSSQPHAPANAEMVLTLSRMPTTEAPAPATREEDTGQVFNPIRVERSEAEAIAPPLGSDTKGHATSPSMPQPDQALARTRAVSNFAHGVQWARMRWGALQQNHSQRAQWCSLAVSALAYWWCTLNLNLVVFDEHDGNFLFHQFLLRAGGDFTKVVSPEREQLSASTKTSIDLLVMLLITAILFALLFIGSKGLCRTRAGEPSSDTGSVSETAAVESERAPIVSRPTAAIFRIAQDVVQRAAVIYRATHSCKRFRVCWVVTNLINLACWMSSVTIMAHQVYPSVASILASALVLDSRRPDNQTGVSKTWLATALILWVYSFEPLLVYAVPMVLVLMAPFAHLLFGPFTAASRFRLFQTLREREDLPPAVIRKRFLWYSGFAGALANMLPSPFVAAHRHWDAVLQTALQSEDSAGLAAYAHFVCVLMLCSVGLAWRLFLALGAGAVEHGDHLWHNSIAWLVLVGFVLNVLLTLVRQILQLFAFESGRETARYWLLLTARVDLRSPVPFSEQADKSGQRWRRLW